MMTLHAEVDEHTYEADLVCDDEGIWVAAIWYVTENGTAKNLVAMYKDVECPAVGDQFRKVNQ
jgi:hypothetical protein